MVLKFWLYSHRVAMKLRTPTISADTGRQTLIPAASRDSEPE